MADFILRQLLLLLEPVGFLWLGLLLLSGTLWWKRQRAFALAPLVLALVVTLVGSTGLPGALLASLERPYAGLKLADLPVCDAIVMLGGGAEPSRWEAAGLHFTKAGDRMIMALELTRLRKAGVLVLGGGAGTLDGEVRAEADLVQRWMTIGGFTTAEVISLGACTNTRAEAEKVRALADQRSWRRVLLVTSANHMRRAEATFRKAGVVAVPVACNFLTEVSTAPAPPGWSVPRYGGFEKVAIWLHEQIGWLIYRRRGWV